jgi:hypothetical protein
MYDIAFHCPDKLTREHLSQFCIVFVIAYDPHLNLAAVGHVKVYLVVKAKLKGAGGCHRIDRAAAKMRRANVLIEMRKFLRWDIS